MRNNCLLHIKSIPRSTFSTCISPEEKLWDFTTFAFIGSGYVSLKKLFILTLVPQRGSPFITVHELCREPKDKAVVKGKINITSNSITQTLEYFISHLLITFPALIKVYRVQFALRNKNQHPMFKTQCCPKHYFQGLKFRLVLEKKFTTIFFLFLAALIILSYTLLTFTENHIKKKM